MATPLRDGEIESCDAVLRDDSKVVIRFTFADKTTLCCHVTKEQAVGLALNIEQVVGVDFN